MGIANLFRDIPTELPEELVEPLLEQEGVRIERIVSRGHASPEGFWYDQDEDEWVLLFTGSAAIRFADEAEARRLSPGDCLLIPAHRKHCVAWTEAQTDTIWLAVFIPPA